MKKLLFIAFSALTLASCAPTQGAKPIVYKGDSATILATAAQICPTIQPTAANNYFSVKTITPTAVTCSATPLTIFALAGASDPVTLIITALQNGETASVAVTEDLGSPTATNFSARDKMLQALDAKFTRIP